MNSCTGCSVGGREQIQVFPFMEEGKKKKKSFSGDFLAAQLLCLFCGLCVLLEPVTQQGALQQ